MINGRVPQNKIAEGLTLAIYHHVLEYPSGLVHEDPLAHIYASDPIIIAAEIAKEAGAQTLTFYQTEGIIRALNDDKYREIGAFITDLNRFDPYERSVKPDLKDMLRAVHKRSLRTAFITDHPEAQSLLEEGDIFIDTMQGEGRFSIEPQLRPWLGREAVKAARMRA